MIRRPPRSTRVRSSAASDVYKRQDHPQGDLLEHKPTSLDSRFGCLARRGVSERLQTMLVTPRDDVLGVHPVKGVVGAVEQPGADRAAHLLLLDLVELADALHPGPD